MCLGVYRFFKHALAPSHVPLREVGAYPELSHSSLELQGGKHAIAIYVQLPKYLFLGTRAGIRGATESHASSSRRFRVFRKLLPIFENEQTAR